MKMNSCITKFYLWALLLHFATFAHAFGVTTPEIVAATKAASLSCSRIAVVGQCQFLNPATGEITTTNEYSMFIPDLVISTYNQPGAIPWPEVRKTNQALLQNVLNRTLGADYASGGHLRSNNGRTITYFKEGAAYGHPATPSEILQKQLSGMAVPYVCPRVTSAMRPYFHSEQDSMAWRIVTPAVPDSPLLQRRVGLANEWGKLFPLNAYVTSSTPHWASGVIAQRIAYLITGGKQRLLPARHVMQPVKNTCGLPGADGTYSCQTFPVEENDPKVARWQPIYPEVAGRCGIFDQGRIDNAMTSPTKTREAVALNLWRCYRCCEPGPGIYIGKISAMPNGQCAL